MNSCKRLSLGIIVSILVMIPGRMHSKEFIVFSVGHDLPMKNDTYEVKKNYFLNIGADQGVKEGTKVNVLRAITTKNPYENQKIINYKVKISELKIIHSNDHSSIGVEETPKKTEVIFDVKGIMIGDTIEVKTN